MDLCIINNDIWFLILYCQVLDLEFADTMRKQATAEREKRSTIIDAEAAAQSIRLTADAEAQFKETSTANHDTASSTSMTDETEAKSTHWFIWVLIVGIVVLAAKRIATLMGW